MTLLLDPLGPGAICRGCGAYHPTAKRAAACTHVGAPDVPIIPGKDTMPTHVAVGTAAPWQPRTYAPRSNVRKVLLAAAKLLVLAGIVLLLWSAFDRAGSAGGGATCCTVTHYVPISEADAREALDSDRETR